QGSHRRRSLLLSECLGCRSLTSCISVHKDADIADTITSNTKPLIILVTASSVVSCFVRVFMSLALCPSGLRHDPSPLVREPAKRHARPLQTAILCTAPQSFAPA